MSTLVSEDEVVPALDWSVEEYRRAEMFDADSSYSRPSPVVSHIDVESSLINKDTVLSEIQIGVILLHKPLVSHL